MSKEIICLLLGTIALLVITVYLGLSLFVARRKVRSTIGTIVDIYKTSAEHFTSQTMAQMGYNVDGKYYLSKNRIYAFRKSKVGDMFPVKYFINNPARLLTKSFEQLGGFLALTLICAALLVYLYFFK